MTLWQDSSFEEQMLRMRWFPIQEPKECLGLHPRHRRFRGDQERWVNGARPNAHFRNDKRDPRKRVMSRLPPRLP